VNFWLPPFVTIARLRDPFEDNHRKLSPRIEAKERASMTSSRRKVCPKSSTLLQRSSACKLQECQQILFQYSIPSSAKEPEAPVRKQNQIVNGACQIFFKKGLNRTSVREIGLACGMSMGQIYHYISSKDNILFLVHKHMYHLWINHLISRGVDDIPDLREKLRKAIRATVDLIIEHKKLFQFVYTESKHLARTHLKIVLEIDEKTTLRFRHQLIAELKVKRFEKKEIPLAASLIAFLNVFDVLRGWTVRDAGRDEIVNFLTDFSLRGIGISESRKRN
jgi:AcrR family transcriptional regulator